MRTFTTVAKNGTPLVLNLYTEGKIFAVTRDPDEVRYCVTHKALGAIVVSAPTLAEARHILRELERDAADWRALRTVDDAPRFKALLDAALTRTAAQTRGSVA